MGRPSESASPDVLATTFDDFSRTLADACQRQNGPFINHVSTNNVARDLDVLRRALGERQISFYGPSYSSMVGAVYASLFPHHVRAMVLDGARAPETRDQVMETISETAAGADLVLHHIDALCRASSNCLLRNVGVAATLDTVLARLRAAPVVAPDGRVLDAPLFQKLIDTQLSVEATWPIVIQGITAAFGGRFDRIFQAVPPVGFKFGAGLGAGSVLRASEFFAFTAVSCIDYGSRRGAAQTLPFDQAFTAHNRLLTARFDVTATTAMCAAWPAFDQPVITRVAGKLNNPILLVGNQFDHRTPLAWTRSLAHTLGMEKSLIRYEGGGHTAYESQEIPCAAAAIESYLFDLKVPAEGFSCKALPVTF